MHGSSEELCHYFAIICYSSCEFTVKTLVSRTAVTLFSLKLSQLSIRRNFLPA